MPRRTSTTAGTGSGRPTVAEAMARVEALTSLVEALVEAQTAEPEAEVRKVDVAKAEAAKTRKARAATAEAGSCAWREYGADGKRGEACGAATRLKSTGGFRRYCGAHNRPYRREHTPEGAAGTFAAALETTRKRRAQNASVYAKANRAAQGATKAGAATTVSVTPSGSSFGLWLAREGIGDRDGQRVVVRMPHRGAANAFAEVVNAHAWEDVKVSPTATVGRARKA